MKLVSMSKLQKFQRNSKELEKLAQEFQRIETETYSEEHLPILAVCVSSDLGLAALYNQTITKAVNELNPDALVWIGSQGYDRWLKRTDIDLLNDRISSDYLNIEDLYDKIVDWLPNYQLHIAVPKMAGDTMKVDWHLLNRRLVQSDFVIYEPSYESANENFQQFYLNLSLYEAYYESKFTENMTRRIAMEQATENANEMREELTNRYNQIRQEEITQEILELAAGVN